MAGGFACCVGGWVARIEAIWSLRLRLHSSLRQSGEGAFYGPYLGLRPRLIYIGPLALGALRIAGGGSLVARNLGGGLF